MLHVWKSCVCMECRRPLSPTAISSSLATFGRLCVPSLASSYYSPQHTIHKPMAKRRWSTAHSPPYFECSARRIFENGKDVYPSPSSPTTVHDAQQHSSLRLRLSMASILCCLWTSSHNLSKSASTWMQVTPLSS